MKKLLMLGAILVLGVTAFAKETTPELENQSEAKVTVKAKLVGENLVISDLEGNPIVLDFGKVSKVREKGTSEAKTGYMVRYVGTGADSLSGKTEEQRKLAMELKGKAGYKASAVKVVLAEASQEDKKVADSFEVTVGLNSYTGVMPETNEKGHDYAEYTGMIFGTLDHANPVVVQNGDTENHSRKLADISSGDYIGFADLKVTINGGEDFQ